MKILIVCNAGASSSAVVLKLQQEADAQGLGWIVEERSSSDYSDAATFDVTLLAPQIRYMEKDIKAIAKKLFLIKPQDYGLMNGAAIIKMIQEG